MERTGTGLDAGPGSDSMISFSHVILMNFKKSVPSLSSFLSLNGDCRIIHYTTVPSVLARGLRGFREQDCGGAIDLVGREGEGGGLTTDRVLTDNVVIGKTC